MTNAKAMDVLMVGAGEYTTGHVATAEGAASDKAAGVIAITLFDLRRLGKVNRMVLCDRSGLHFAAIRSTLQAKIGSVYRDMDLQLDTFPADNVPHDPHAYLAAMDSMSPGSMVTIFTPDDTHFDIAMAAIQRGLHVLIAKPVVKTLQHHRQLIQAAAEKGVLVAVEFHKRFDPIYLDARDRLQRMGPFSFFSSTMTQPKKQLLTFAAWAGISSDISYYLNSHHIDFHSWTVSSSSRPVRVVASSSSGLAAAKLNRQLEDSITLLVDWQNSDGSRGTAVYTAGWIAPPSDCHTQQYFHCAMHQGEVRVDQAHRGFTAASDAAGFASLNPLYMKYTPDSSGFFAGQQGYGYRSIAHFLQAAGELNEGKNSLEEIRREGILATVDSCLYTTAILEAGRRSLDEGLPVYIEYNDEQQPSALTMINPA